MNRNRQTVQRAYMHNQIPYRHCFEEGGMIETEAGVYSRTYEIVPPEEEAKGSYSSKRTKIIMENILQKLAEKFTFQFTIRNCNMDMEDYLSAVSLDENREKDAYQHFRQLYNGVLQENCNIGHNNFTRKVFLTLSTKADTPEQALAAFGGADTWLSESFGALYGFKIVALELTERLKLLYDFYHPEPDAAPFGERVDYDGNGFSIRSMQRMKMDTKDTIAPDRYECKERNYMMVGSYYVRTFFINSLPETVPDSILLDLASNVIDLSIFL